MRASWILAPLLVLAALPAGCDKEADAQAAWYDPAPLLQSLRANERAGILRSAGITRLDALPLYDFDLEIAPDLGSFTLKEDIWLTNTYGQPLNEVVFRIFANATAETPPVTLTGSECVGQRCRVAFDGSSVITVTPSSAIAPDARIRVRLELRGTMREIDAAQTNMLAQAMSSMARMGGHGGHSGDYGMLAHGEGVGSLGNFYAVLAPRRNNDWVRTTASTMGDLGGGGMQHFRAVIKTARGVRVASTGVTTDERTVLADDATPIHTETRVAAAMVRDFAVIVSPRFEMSERDVGGVTLRSWFLEGDRTGGEAVLETAVHSLRTYEQRFGPYPYADLDLCEAALVGGAGGVEFSGLVTMASMFYRPIGASMGLGGLGGLLGSPTRGGGAAQPMDPMSSAMLEFVTAHEVAHQWWHGIVGSDSREHPFVDESLAQFSAVLHMETRYGAERAQTEANRQVRANYHMFRLRGGADAAVDQPVAAFSDEMAYAGLVYGKGPFMYPAIRAVLDDATFFTAMQSYVRDHRFRIAGERALIDRFAQGPAEAEVRRLAQRWLEETHGDDDLGQPEASNVFDGWLNSGFNLGPLQGLLQGVLGGMGNVRTAPTGQPPGTGTPGQSAGQPGQTIPSNPQELEQALQELNRLLNQAQGATNNP